MVFKILKHDWQSFIRAPFWGQSAVQYILLGIFGLYIIGILYSVGFISQELLEQYFPNQNPVTVANKYLIYYLLSDLIIRYTLQKYPSLFIKRYMTQNVSKSMLSHYLTSRSLFSFFNIAPLFFFIPFYSKCLAPVLSASEGRQWIIMIVLLILITHLISLFVDKSFAKVKSLSLLILGATVLLLNLDYKGYLSLSSLTAPVFDFIYTHIIGLAFLLIAVFLLYFLNYSLVRNNLYLDELQINKKSQSFSATSFSFFDRFGTDVGRLMELDAKLIWRNKRTRSFFYASLLFMLYPFIFMEGGGFPNTVLMIIGSLFAVGSFGLNFGQIMISMNSSHFDFILSQGIKLKDYLNAKFIFLALCNTMLFFITLPYGFLAPKMILVNAMMVLFVTGVIFFMYLSLSLHYSNKFEINSGGMFKMQGFSAAHFLVMIPIIVAPLVIYFIFRAFDLRMLGIVMIGVVGLIGILLKNYFINMAEKSLINNKYRLNTNFKK